MGWYRYFEVDPTEYCTLEAPPPKSK